MIMNNTHKNDEINDKKQTCNVLCKILDIGLGLVLVCLEEKPEKCTFSLSFGHRHLCKLQLLYTSLSITETGIQRR